MDIERIRRDEGREVPREQFDVARRDLVLRGQHDLALATVLTHDHKE
jgi:hypothetical protein